MAKLTLNNVANAGTSGIASINANSDLIEAAIENTLSRDGTSPNQMNVDLDMNNNDILNISSIDVEVLYIDGQPVTPTELSTIPNNSVGADQIIDGSITEPNYGTGSVSTRALADDSVTIDKIANNAVGTNQLLNDAVTEDKILDSLLAELRYVNPNGPRIPVNYYSATSTSIVGVRNIAMGGFRFKGQYKEGRAKSFAMPAFTSEERHVIDLGNGTSTAGDLFSEAWHVKSNWYANFAAADDGDSVATLGSMPYLRVRSIAGNVITLNNGGENQRTAATKTYQFATNALVGAEVLVISETLDARANAFSGRMTTVTANTATTVTLDNVGSMAAYDYFLVAPPGYDHYCYLNSFYMDTAEVRNIADTGTVVGSRGAANLEVSLDGLISPYIKMPFDGHISPLAVAVTISQTDTLPASTGDLVMRWGMDEGSHDTHDFYYFKNEGTTGARVNTFTNVPFSFGQQLVFYSGGSLNAVGTTRAAGVRGYLEL